MAVNSQECESVIAALYTGRKECKSKSWMHDCGMGILGVIEKPVTIVIVLIQASIFKFLILYNWIKMNDKNEPNHL